MASCLRLVSSKAPSAAARSAVLGLKRNAHHKSRGLPYDVERGLGKFLPPPALHTLVEYQDGLLERLNHELKNDPKIERHASVAQTAIDYAAKRDRTLAFNYSVLALNNSFFLDQLTPPSESAPNHEDKISRVLQTQIEQNYGDLTRLKSSFSAAAMGLFSSGWVWLVTDSNGNLGILPTFGPSTLLVASRMNMHHDPTSPVLGEDTARHAAATSAPPPLPETGWTLPPTGRTATFKNFDFQSRTMHTSAPVANSQPFQGMASLTNPLEGEPTPKPTLANVGKTIFPLLCIPVYEHAWMSAGYGVWGKEAWLKEFWSVVDWSKVSDAYNKHLVAKHM